MTAPTLFDPVARMTDPDTSHAAAKSVRPANRELIDKIETFVREHGPVSQETIGLALGGARWTVGTVVTACARADLVPAGKARNGRGREVTLWQIALKS